MDQELLKNISFGGVKSPPDYRDIPFAAIATAAGVPTALPDSYFPTGNLISRLPIWNQRKIGACVGHAWAKTQQKSELQENGEIVPLSARFLYAIAKSQDGVPGEGTYPRIVAKILKNQGCATENTLPNDTTLTHAQYIDLTAITQAAYDEAKKYAIGGYSWAENTLLGLKQAIYYAGEQRKDVVMLVNLGKEWWTDPAGNITYDPALLLPLRAPAIVVSGHEIYPYAYEKDPANGKTKIWFINSWSDAWALKGHGWFYYEDYATFILEIMAGADLPDDWQSQIQNLPPAQQFSHSFQTDILYGQQSDEVAALQTALMIDGEFDKALYTKLLSQKQLGFYGDITRQAVLAFQKRYNIASLWELIFLNGKKVGPKTRAKLNQLFNK